MTIIIQIVDIQLSVIERALGRVSIILSLSPSSTNHKLCDNRNVIDLSEPWNIHLQKVANKIGLTYLEASLKD